MISVVSWGIAGSVVDRGRTGLGWLGHSRGGAVDLASMALAHRLVGNPESCSVLESSGGLVLDLHQPTMLAISGATAELTVTAGPAIGWGSPVVLPAGSRVRVGRLLAGARLYLAIRGGITQVGDQLTIGPDPATPAGTEPAPRLAPSTLLRVWPGPRLDWFPADVWPSLFATTFSVSGTSRVGLRLSGPSLAAPTGRQLPSEGLVEGAIQLPPDGQPIIMLADHPTTGGYPVIAVLDVRDLRHAGQAAVGTHLRFTPAR